MGILVSQYRFIVQDAYISSLIITLIIAMILSFSLGSYAALENRSELRILSWSLVLSSLILILMVVFVASSSQYLKEPLWIEYALLALLMVLNALSVTKFSKFLEGIFASKHLNVPEYNPKWFFQFFIPVFVTMVGIIIAIIMSLTNLGLLTL